MQPNHTKLTSLKLFPTIPTTSFSPKQQHIINFNNNSDPKKVQQQQQGKGDEGDKDTDSATLLFLSMTLGGSKFVSDISSSSTSVKN